MENYGYKSDSSVCASIGSEIAPESCRLTGNQDSTTLKYKHI